MSYENQITCLSPALPKSCLQNLSGWLLRALLCENEEIINGVEHYYLYEDTYVSEAAEIDEDFIRFFKGASDENVLKQALLRRNKELLDTIEIDQEIDLMKLDLIDIIQHVVAENSTSLPIIDLIILSTAKVVRPGNIDGYALQISTDTIKSISLSRWLEQCHAGQ